jgi:diaminopimelate epimerase
MRIAFTKYHGTGNDFIMIDGREGDFRLEKNEIVRLCDRHFGIGSDGLIIIRNHASEDFYMDFYNPDVSQSFCGNGSRCAVAFARSLGVVSNHGVFAAIDGNHPFVVHESMLTGAMEIQVRMRDVSTIESVGNDCIIQTGSPHYIVPFENLDQLDIVSSAHAIRYNDRFKAEGINVNFVRYGSGELWMRTYERGVEAETLSCGTGVTAAALSLAIRNQSLTTVDVHTKGGALRVKFERTSSGGFEDIWLCGPAEIVFSGEIETAQG